MLLFLQLHSRLDCRVLTTAHTPLCCLCLFNELLFSRSAGIEFHNNNNKIRANITSAIVLLKLMIRTKFMQTNQRLKLDFQEGNYDWSLKKHICGVVHAQGKNNPSKTYLHTFIGWTLRNEIVIYSFHTENLKENKKV